VPAATIIGAAKEISDVNFNGPDFIAWPVGALLYKLGKEHGWCWQHQQAVIEEYPYIFHQRECIK
jgi:hypothetical protein